MLSETTQCVVCVIVYLCVCFIDDSTRVVLSGAQDYINASHIIVSAQFVSMLALLLLLYLCSLSLSVCLSVCVYLALCVSVCLSVCLSVCVCLSVHLSVCLSLCLSVCLSVCLSLCLSVCLAESGGGKPVDWLPVSCAI